jgi:hypothetical protein
MDSCRDFGDFVVARAGNFLHARRLCAHFAGTSDHNRAHPRDSGETTDLEPKSHGLWRGLEGHVSRTRATG